jgi:Fe-S-cluster containining protein
MQFNLLDSVKNGFKFSCQKCGKCCTGKGEGQIFIYKPDVERLFKHFKCNSESEKTVFAREHFDTTSQKFVLKEKDSKHRKYYHFDTLVIKVIGDAENCSFLENGNVCKIYDARPFQCVAYPLWRILVTNQRNWNENAQKCKGINNRKGDYFSKEEILEKLKEEFRLEKEYFLEMQKHDFKIEKIYPFLKGN